MTTYKHSSESWSLSTASCLRITIFSGSSGVNMIIEVSVVKVKTLTGSRKQQKRNTEWILPLNLFH
jgi:hypothetical protein